MSVCKVPGHFARVLDAKAEETQDTTAVTFENGVHSGGKMKLQKRKPGVGRFAAGI